MDILDQMKLQTTERVAQHADEMRRESQREGSFVHACRATINNRRLAPCESNRAMLESLLNPGEDPSTKLYVALIEQFPIDLPGNSQGAADEGRSTRRVRRFRSRQRLFKLRGKLSVIQSRREHREFHRCKRSRKNGIRGTSFSAAQ